MVYCVSSFANSIKLFISCLSLKVWDLAAGSISLKLDFKTYKLGIFRFNQT